MLSTSTEAADTLRTTLKTAPMMKAIRFHGPGDIRLDEVEEPVCGKGQVKVSLDRLTQIVRLLRQQPTDAAGLCWNLRQWYVQYVLWNCPF